MDGVASAFLGLVVDLPPPPRLHQVVIDPHVDGVWSALFPVTEVKGVLASFLVRKPSITPVDDNGPPNGGYPESS